MTGNILQFPREIVAQKEEREEERRLLEDYHEEEMRPYVWRALEILGRDRVAFLLQKLMCTWKGEKKD